MSRSASTEAAVPPGPDPVRITWVSPSYGYGGDLLYFRGLFEAFCRRFPATSILVDRRVPYRDAAHLPLRPGLEGWLIGAQRQVGSALYNAGVHVPYPAFLLHLAASRPQVLIVIEFTLAALLAVAFARWRRGVAVLLLVESDPSGRGAGGNRWVLALKRWACRRADAIQTCNEAGRRYLTETLRADPGKIQVAPYLTACPPLPPGLAAPPADGRVRILFANSLTARKGADRLLAALAMLPAEVAGKIALTVVGDGPERPGLEAMAAALSAIPITFAGARPYAELGPFYAAADVLAVPSLADYRSLAGFEGLGHGLALLASIADGASAETLDGGRTGLAIDPEDPASIAAAITRLVTQPGLLEQCRHNAADLFAQSFSFERIATNLAASVEQACADAALRG